MRSARWAKRRSRYFANHPRRCTACGAVERIELHHRSYERFSAEGDDDLRALCSVCHGFVHVLERTTALSLAAATDRVVAAMRAARAPAPRPTGAAVRVGRGCSSIDEAFAADRERCRAGYRRAGLATMRSKEVVVLLRARERFRRAHASDTRPALPLFAAK